MSLPELYDWNAAHSPDHPLFVYNDVDGSKTITWSQAVRMIHDAARYVRDRSTLSSRDPHSPPVIAILASSGAYSHSFVSMRSHVKVHVQTLSHTFAH